MGVKICFHLYRYQNQNFSLVFYSCRTHAVSVAVVSHSCCSCLTRVAFVSFVSLSRWICVARVAVVSLVSGTRVVK